MYVLSRPAIKFIIYLLCEFVIENNSIYGLYPSSIVLSDSFIFNWPPSPRHNKCTSQASFPHVHTAKFPHFCLKPFPCPITSGLDILTTVVTCTLLLATLYRFSGKGRWQSIAGKSRVLLEFVLQSWAIRLSPRLHELAPHDQREPVGGIHAT